MANKFFVAPSPHVHSAQSTQSLMRDVLIALVPALAVSVWVYGLNVLLVTAVAVISCVLFEFLIQKYLIKGQSTIYNTEPSSTESPLFTFTDVTLPSRPA